MPSGFFALLDDVAGIAKLAAASLDDVAGTAGRVGLKAAGVVVDDTAVTPRYVAGLTPDRELPMIGRITLGSLRNKLLILLPVALLLNWLAPWAVTPLLMIGGLFLCYEGGEKIVEVLFATGRHAAEEAVEPDPKRLEDGRVRSAIRTDLILSGEIMAISLAEVADKPLLVEAVVLTLVGFVLTLGVYGVVAMVVKVDDVGLHLARTGRAPTRALGRGLVRGMPHVMAALSAIGTAAMIWVGGGILVHGLAALGIAAPAAVLDAAALAVESIVPGSMAGVVHWAVEVVGSGCVGLVIGGVIVAVVKGIARLRA